MDTRYDDTTRESRPDPRTDPTGLAPRYFSMTISIPRARNTTISGGTTRRVDISDPLDDGPVGGIPAGPVIYAGQGIREIPPDVCEHVAAQYEKHDKGRASAEWPAYLRMLDAIDPGYRD
jgi:hypothetical protein